MLLGAATTVVGMPFNGFVGLSINHSIYEISRLVGGVSTTARPEVLVVGGHGGIEYVFPQHLGGFGFFSWVPRAQVDLVGVVMESFTEAPQVLRVSAVEEVLVSFTPSVELRRAQKNFFGAWCMAG